MNSTLKSMLFWMVLVVVGVLVWNFSTRFQTRDEAISFSEFMTQVETGQVRTSRSPATRSPARRRRNETFRTHAPTQYEGLANRLIDKRRHRPGQGPDRPARGRRCCTPGRPILLLIGFWIFFMRQMQSGGNKALSFGKSKAKLSSSRRRR